MPYELTLLLPLGILNIGLTDLRAQLLDTDAEAVGDEIDEGFAEIGNGDYLFTYVGYPSGQRVGVKFYRAIAPANILTSVAINPEEVETPTLLQTAIAALPAAVWTYAAGAGRTLSGFGTLVTDLAAAVWAYALRTLTATATQTQDAVEGDMLTIYNSVTFAATLTGLSVPATWTKVYFTVKRANGLRDAVAAIQIVVTNPAAVLTDGLISLNGRSPDIAWASLAITQVSGTVAIAIADDATVWLDAGDYVYDIKAIDDASHSYLLTSGECVIELTTTEAIA